MRTPLAAVVWGAAAVAGAPSARALDPAKAVTQYGHDVWRTEDGLPESSVHAVLQTRDGYLWIATQEGLVRFDGARFAVFDKARVPELRSNFIQTLAEGRDGSLWIGTGGGGLTRLRDGVFASFTTRDGLTSNVVWALHEDRRGTLWIATGDGGLNRFRDGRFTALTTRDGLPTDRVLSLFEDRSGALWAGTDGGGVVRQRDGSLDVFGRREGLPGDAVHAIREDREGRLWVGTDGGLARREGERFLPFTRSHGLAGQRVNALLADRDGSLWIGYQGAGLDRLSRGRVTHFSTRDGLSSDLVAGLYEDRDGHVWVGTWGGGLNRLRDGKVTALTTREGLPNDLVWGVYEDSHANLWLATDGGGLVRYRDGRFSALTTRDGLSTDSVRSIVEGRDGSLWIGTWGGGLNRLKDGRVTVYGRKQGLSHDMIRSVYEDREGNLWIGTYGGGLDLFRDGRFTVYTTKDGLPGDIVYCTLQDRKGDLWIGTRGGGLGRLRDGRFAVYTTRDGLSDNIVLSLHEDADGALWIGTRAGINRLKAGRFTHVSRAHGLFDDVAYRILEDDRGFLWASSNKGIYRVSKKEFDDVVSGRVARLASLSFGKADGMKASECNGGVQPAGWRTRDGRLWFPTIRGVVVLDPARLPRNERPPPVVVEAVAVDGRAYDPHREIAAPPGRGEIELLYAALAFGAPDRVRFRRKLEGFDADWVDVAGAREANYTNIPPGEYVFRVTACNEDGVWNEEGTAVRLRLAPHLHQTLSFRLGLAALVLLAAAGFYGLRVRELQARERELAALVERRTADLLEARRGLERANQELRGAIAVKDDVVSIVAHDFRSPLTVIQGYTELLQGRSWDEESLRMLAAIDERSRHLAALAADTLTMSRIESGHLALDPRPVRVAALVREVVEARSASAGAAGRIALEAPEEGLEITADAERLRQVVDNLLGNAVAYSPPGAPVEVQVRAETEGVGLVVRDHGIGISREDLPRLFQRFSRLASATDRGISGTGLGLYICRAIVEAHGGRIGVESEPGRGSTFHVVLPREPSRPPGQAAA